MGTVTKTVYAPCDHLDEHGVGCPKPAEYNKHGKNLCGAHWKPKPRSLFDGWTVKVVPLQGTKTWHPNCEHDWVQRYDQAGAIMFIAACFVERVIYVADPGLTLNEYKFQPGAVNLLKGIK